MSVESNDKRIGATGTPWRSSGWDSALSLPWPRLNPWAAKPKEKKNLEKNWGLYFMSFKFCFLITHSFFIKV